MTFNHLPMIAKIFALLGMLGLVAGGGAVLTGARITGLSDEYQQLNDGPGQAALYFAEANRQSVWIERSILQNIWSTSAETNVKYAGDTQAGATRFEALMDAARGALPDQAAAIDGFKSRFHRTFATSCAKTIQMANASTTLEGNAKAMAELNAGCGPELSALAAEIAGFAGDLGRSFKARTDVLGASARRAALWSYAIVFGGLAAVLALAGVVTSFAIVAPIRRLVGTMSIMSQGDLAVAVAGVDRRDELGAMAKAVEIFRGGLAEAERLRRDQEDAQALAVERLAARNSAAEGFVSRMGGLANAFAQSSYEVSGAARNLAATAEETSRQAQVVSGAAGEASQNVQTVAAATEEMSVSVQEISSQVHKAADIASAATVEAKVTRVDIQSLRTAATEIGAVVELINDIAAQTNLLALNATIEAARAGEAGRGFAIVAHEVKQLAGKTADATKEIGAKVADIQEATTRTASSLERIADTIVLIHSVSATIAGAVEEQGAATQEIALNTQRAAQGANDVTGNIVGVGSAAEMTGAASAQLMSLSGALSDQASELKREVSDFVVSLQAA